MSPSTDSAAPTERVRSTPPLVAAAVVLATPAIARLQPARLRRVLGAVRVGSRKPRQDEAVRRTERAIALAARLRRQTCLTRGIARFVLLRRAGVPVQLVFGLGPDNGAYAGHCWIELAGEPYLEREDPRSLFPEMFRIPEPPA